MHRLMTGCLGALALGGICTTPAGATVVTAMSGGTTYTFGTSNYRGGDTQVVAPGITWSSSNSQYQAGAVYGYNGGYGFAGNGYWDGAFSMIGVNDSYAPYGVVDSMTIAFATPVRSVGSFLNYDPDLGDAATIAVYDTVGNLIESYSLSFALGVAANNAGVFYGFVEPSAEIGSIAYSNAYIGAADLVVDGASAIGEPMSLMLLGTGLVRMGLLRRLNRHPRAR